MLYHKLQIYLKMFRNKSVFKTFALNVKEQL